MDALSRTAKRECPLSIRLPSDDVSLIDRAASLRGRSRADFIREAAVKAAEEVLMENLPIRMKARGFAAFTAALAGPAKPVRELVAALKHRAPWEKGSASLCR